MKIGTNNKQKSKPRKSKAVPNSFKFQLTAPTVPASTSTHHQQKASNYSDSFVSSTNSLVTTFQVSKSSRKVCILYLLSALKFVTPHTATHVSSNHRNMPSQ
ncbi:unnamed protein product [Ambrosiozyma monospora]|uniref:Unnamed protein product n=1 Tax=Ambrosiozyma monospora TaxID=43982 RepID=A0ACB5TSB1_AMBMO|nr:unnamed protein product [Ambrosiozyma monospora]